MILATFFVALTLAVATFDSNGWAFMVSWAFSNLVVTTTLALPLVCRPSLRPFWAAYAVTTAFALVWRGTEGDPFHFFSASVGVLVFGNINLDDGNFFQRLVGACIGLWNPVFYGLLSGSLMVAAQKTLGTPKDDG